ncbi:codanin-1 isoform X2 [Strongylocentrotus purpuratus]|uniref:Codanin-1 C-terminal domain-containing protein n=1 Tax=Strongylocentrotus purpuratus TaxID=7668 RepID=A0A7M7HCR2_STRPU|nr:codanin-1 isoform X2 [Strongylocentrotus purpuratus]
MAVILEHILSTKLSIQEVLEWSVEGKVENSGFADLLRDTKLQTEFLPFFINSLRDQTAHLVCRGSSAVSSPARTPSSLQKLKRANQTRPQRSGGSKVNRTQLFAADNSKSSWSDKDFTPVSRLTAVEQSPHTPSSSKTNGRHGRNVSWSGGGGDAGSSSRRKTPGSGSRKDESITLAQFLVTPESQSRGKGRKSPFEDSNCDSSSSHKSSSSRRRSGGKGKQTGQNESGGSKGQHKLKYIDKPVFDLENAQEFPPMGVPRTITPRRITPTAVSSSSGGSRRVTTLLSPAPSCQGQNQETNAFNPPVNQTAATKRDTHELKKSLENERELLKQEKMKQKNQPECSPFSQNALGQSPRGMSVLQSPKGMTLAHTPTKLLRSNSVSSITEAILPDVEKVTGHDKLDLIAELYASFLQESLVPNLSVELYFLIQLLTAKGSKLDEDEGIHSLEEDIEDINYLSTIHNCVYFAASVLSRLVVVLSLLDKSTLRLLADNQVVSQFNPELKTRLEQVTNHCPTESGLQAAITSPMQVVPFLADTDNRQNFPSDTSFHSFKKQRDGFYSLIRDWEDNRSKPGWKMQEKLTHRIRDLMKHMDVTNYTHFSRLFQSQLIKMCQGDSSVVDSGDSQEFSFIQQLRRTNPGKFKRLEERFSTPASSGGPCPPPSFHGCQEFFRDFILATNSYIFNQHLTDSFATKLIELNDLQLPITDQVDMTSVVDAEVRESFSSCLLALRVLSKFLGFLVFLPYQGDNNLPDIMKDNVIMMRSRASLPVDILGCLSASETNQRLILTLPWVVEYLSMIDGLASQIPVYYQTLSLLGDIHRRVSVQWSETPSNHNSLLILLLLGWLFENPALPSNLHLTSGVSVERGSHNNKPGSDQSLDPLPLVDRLVLYTCCPFLGDLRGLLSEASMGVNNRNAPVKKITPVAVDAPQTAIITQHQIQVELEKNFFHIHSASLKKSVEFVSGRVASNCIKSIDGSLVSAARLQIPKLLTEVLVSSSSSKKEAGALTAKAKGVGEKLSLETAELARKEAKEFIKKKCRSALDVLLPCETSETVLDTACAITTRLALERTEKWITTQIPSALQQEVTLQLPKCLRAQSTQQMKKESTSRKIPDKPAMHDRQGACPSTVIQELKDGLHRILIGDTDGNTAEGICSSINNVHMMINNRQDLTPLAYQSIHQLTIELCVSLAMRQPTLLQTSVCTSPTISKGQRSIVLPQDSNTHGKNCSSSLHNTENGKHQDKNLICSTQGVVEDGEEQCNNQESGLHSHLGRYGQELQCNTKGGQGTEEGAFTTPVHKHAWNGDQGERDVTNAEQTEGDVTLHRSNTDTLLERLMGLWRNVFSLSIPPGALLSARTAWMISHSHNPQVSWQCLIHIVKSLLACNLVSIGAVQSALSKMMMSSYIPPITEDVARSLLPLVTDNEIGADQNALDLLHAVCSEARENEDAYS